MDKIGFHANGFVIIDLVPEKDMQTARHIEENLLDFINSKKSNSYCERYRPETKTALIEVFEKIKKRIKEKGEIPYIHLEGHSSKEYLCLLNGLKLEWSVVFEYFREINILCKNNLFFSSGACQSAYAIKAASITKPCPIFGMLAPEQKVEAGKVLDGYVAFYKSLISNQSLSEAFNKFADVANGKEYALIFSPFLFEKAAYNYITEHCMGKGKKKRLENIVTQAVNNIGISPNKARKDLKKELNKPQALNLSKFHSVFMMSDIYPENKKRFEFNAVKFERDVKNGKLKNV